MRVNCYHNAVVIYDELRQPLIAPKREPDLYNYIIGKADSHRCIVHAIGGIENHIHLVVSIPPTMAIADFVQNIKGSSSHQMNQILSSSEAKFGWQRGYGVFSLGRKQLDEAIAYVKNQKEHHLQGTIITALELETDEDDGSKLGDYLII
ncbi:IS200/IS605 family transposase [Aerosakkonema funiforme]|uniref:IS200/IS605 family transposase n=1 Tax=Aerosakkonema funiforme TaxID=1246630 RepID=UPI0035BA89EC